jgi:hypothetical protein
MAITTIAHSRDSPSLSHKNHYLIAHSHDTPSLSHSHQYPIAFGTPPTSPPAPTDPHPVPVSALRSVAARRISGTSMCVCVCVCGGGGGVFPAPVCAGPVHIQDSVGGVCRLALDTASSTRYSRRRYPPRLHTARDTPLAPRPRPDGTSAVCRDGDTPRGGTCGTAVRLDTHQIRQYATDTYSTPDTVRGRQYAMAARMRSAAPRRRAISRRCAISARPRGRGRGRGRGGPWC